MHNQMRVMAQRLQQTVPQLTAEALRGSCVRHFQERGSAASAASDLLHTSLAAL